MTAHFTFLLLILKNPFPVEQKKIGVGGKIPVTFPIEAADVEASPFSDSAFHASKSFSIKFERGYTFF